MNQLKYLKLLLLLAAAFLFPAGEAAAKCLADFNFKVDCATKKVTFSNTSYMDSLATYTYAWTFGNGGTSVDRSPARTYTSAGTYTVCLRVTQNYNGNICVDSICKQVNIPQTCCDIKAGFNFTVNCSAKKVQFAETAVNDAGATYKWYFGDGATGTSANPDHIYSAAGVYTVCLYVSKYVNNVLCADSICKLVEIPKNCCDIKAAFDVRVDCSGRKLFVTDKSVNDSNATHVWYWGDGSNNVNNNNTADHIYSVAGNYYVCLYVQKYVGNQICMDSICKYVEIPKNCCNLRPQFSYKVDCSNRKLSVYNTSPLDSLATYTWLWGDGTSSAGSTTSHSYANAGWFNVCLVAQKMLNGKACTDTFCQYVEIPKNCCNIKADFSYKVDCIKKVILVTNTSANGSSGVTSKWFWGDGTYNVHTNSTADHRYTNAGVYTVCLYVERTDSNKVVCRDSICKRIEIPKNCCNLNPNFNYHVDCNKRKVSVYDTFPSNAGATRYWYWGDGTSALHTNDAADHAYANPGTYTLCLLIKRYDSLNNVTCMDSLCRQIVIPQNCCNITADFTFKVDCAKRKINVSSSTAASNTTSVRWLWGDGTSGYGTNADHIYPKGGVYNVCVVVTQFGYRDTLKQDTFTICSEVKCKQVIIPESCCDVKASFDVKVDCAKRKIFVSNTSAGGTLTSVQWLWGDGTTGSGNYADHIYSATGNYTVCIAVTQYGFRNNDTLKRDTFRLCTDTFCKVVEIPKNCCDVKADFTFKNDCKLFLFNNLSSSGAGISYLWEFGDGSVSTDKKPYYQYKKGGTYQVCLTVKRKIPGTNLECKTTVCKKVQVPDNCCRISADFKVITIGTFGLFTNRSSSDAYYYEWSFPDNNSSTDKNPWFNFHKKGTYNVCLTVWNKDRSCKASICKKVTIRGFFGNGLMVAPQPVEVNTIDDDATPVSDKPSVAVQEMTVFPNPASDQVTIQIQGLENAVVTLKNINGVEAGKAQMLETNVFKADVSGLQPGVYIVVASGSNGLITARFVKN